jgi:magnesium-transporting ATPase (P-type)
VKRLGGIAIAAAVSTGLIVGSWRRAARSADNEARHRELADLIGRQTRTVEHQTKVMIEAVTETSATVAATLVASALMNQPSKPKRRSLMDALNWFFSAEFLKGVAIQTVGTLAAALIIVWVALAYGAGNYNEQAQEAARYAYLITGILGSSFLTFILVGSVLLAFSRKITYFKNRPWGLAFTVAIISVTAAKIVATLVHNALRVT